MAYSMAVASEADNPIPHFHMGQCYQALGDKMNANKSYQLALEFAKGQHQYKLLQQAIEKALKDKWLFIK